jgi:hypothetical protein
MVTGRYCSSNSHRSRAQEVARSGANERGRRGDSIPYLTYRGDASWLSNFDQEGDGCGSVHGGGWAPGADCRGAAAAGKEDAAQGRGAGL